MRHPRLVLAIWAALLVAAAPGVARLEIDSSTASFLDRGHPAWQIYQRSVSTFGGDEFLTIGLETESAFDRDALEELRALTSELEAVPGVRRVDSLATVPLIRSEADGRLLFDAILSRPVPDSADEIGRMVDAIRADAIAPRALVSADERLLAINVLLNRDIDADRAETVAQVRRALTGRAALVSGVPVFRTAVNAKTRSDLLLFLPLTLGIVALVLVASFRGAVAVMVPLMIGLVGTTSALGAMGAADVTLSLSTMILPSVLLALGCAYAMHILIAGRCARDFVELERQLVRVARPVALSGLTTIFGFLAMATVRISAIRELATYGAVGVLWITLASLTLAPAILTLWPLKPESRSIDAWIRERCSGFLVALVARHRAAIVLGWVIALLAVSVGLWRLEVSTDIIRWFPPSTEVRSDYETIKRRLAGITPVNVMIEATNGASVTRPDALAAIGALSTALDELPQIGKAISVADPIRQVHRVFNRDPAAELPSDGGVIEQYLLLLEGVDYMRDLVSPDRSVANILLRMNDNSSSEIVALGDWVREWWRSAELGDFEVITTGIMYEFGRAEEQIAYGQIQGLLLAFSAIGLVLLAVLRRPLLALVALIPNVVPVAMAFGSMGLLGIPLDAATVCMGSLALGIAVDDTVHVATGYRDERGVGLPPLTAIGACLSRVLPALVLTTVCISAGFAVLGLSEFLLIRNLGIVTALLVALCLLADVTLLPALLLKVDSRDPSR